MDLLYVFLSSIGSFVVLFFLTKLMGNRQMSQLSMFDYIIGITIGSIAAEMASGFEKFEKPLIAMGVFALFSILFTFLTSKSIKCRRFLTGETLILLDDGKLYEKNFKKSKLDLSEFLSQCRNSGYFNIADIQTAILEPNGKISFLPAPTKRPATPNDLNLSPPVEKPIVNIIIDGKILSDNLKFIGKNEDWLKKELKAQGLTNINDIFLATCDFNNQLSVYIRHKKPATRDMFE